VNNSINSPELNLKIKNRIYCPVFRNMLLYYIPRLKKKL